MPFSKPTLQEIIDRIEGDFTTRVSGTSSFLRRSVFKIMARAYGAAVYTLYGYLNFMKDQLFATSADAEFLEMIGNEYGITRKAPVAATGECRATGTNGYTIPAGTELQYTDEQLYTVDEDAIIVTGYADLLLTAKEAGEDGNQSGSGTLTFVSPIIGINSTATIDTAGIFGGLDQESDDDLRERILARKRQPPAGGAEFDYTIWALEVSGVTRAWTIPQYYGIGTVGVAFVRDNDPSTIIPNATQRQEVRDYILEHIDPLTGITVGCPVTAEPGLFVIDISEQTFDFEVDIVPNNVTVQGYVQDMIESLILEKGGPGETMYYSDMVKYISNATGVTAIRMVSPSADIGVATNKVPVLGTITYGDY